MSAPGYTAGGTSITVGSTSNWPSDTGVVFAIDRAEVVNGVEVQIPGSYNEFIGTVASGTSVTNVDWVSGAGDTNYASGALTRVYVPVSAERENRIVTWGLGHADQDGTLKSGAIDNVSVFSNGVVSTTAPFSTDLNPETRLSETIRNVVASGLEWTTLSGLNGTMSAGIVYINGKRISVSSVASKTFTVSKDTYVGVDNAGAISYTEVANNASSPALPANTVWLAVVVTNGSAITAINFTGVDSNSVVVRPMPIGTKQTDANGWTVIDNGKTREYIYKTASSGVTKVQYEAWDAFTINLPNGLVDTRVKDAQLTMVYGAFNEFASHNLRFSTSTVILRMASFYSGSAAFTYSFYVRLTA